MPTSTKWRLNISAGNGPTWLGIATLTMAATPGGANLCTGGTASANSVSGGFEASKAFDANITTYWSTSSGTTGWLQYEFASPVAITAYTVQASNNASGYTPQAWTLEYWDGSAWQVTDTVTGQTGWLTSELRSFPVLAKMRWRVKSTANYSGSFSFTELAEIEFRTAVGGANQATSGFRGTADTVAATHPASHANDGNGATYWSSTNSAFPHTWVYWFDQPLDIVEYRLQAATGGQEAYAPKSWTLEYWDGVVWVAVDTQTDAAAWTSGESRTFVTVAPPIVGSAVFGVHTTVQATRAIAFGLDNNTNVLTDAGTFKVFGDLAVTGTTMLDDTIAERGRTTPMGSWATYTPTWTNVTVGNGTVTAKSSKVGTTVNFAVLLTFGSTTAITGNAAVSTPTAFSAAAGPVSHGRVMTRDVSAGIYYAGLSVTVSSGVIGLYVENPSAAAKGMVPVTATVPFTWATGDQVFLGGTYDET